MDEAKQRRRIRQFEEDWKRQDWEEYQDAESRPGMWRTDLWKEPRLLDLQGDGPLTPDSEPRIGRLLREPWMAEVMQITGLFGWWTGTAAELFARLRLRADGPTYRSRDFPSTLAQLERYLFAVTHELRVANVDVMDLRRNPVEELDWRYDVPDWSYDHPILVYRTDANIYRDYYLEAEKHPDRLVVTLMNVLARTRGGEHKRWEGTTYDLARALRRELDDGVCSPQSPIERANLFKVADPESLSELHEWLVRRRPIFDHLGIRIGCSEEVDGSARWLIEVPLWLHSLP